MKKNLSIKIKHLAIMVPVLLTLLSACDKRMRPHVHEHFNVAREDGKIIVKSSSKGHVTSIFYYKDGEYYDSSDSALFFSTKKDTTINVFFCGIKYQIVIKKENENQYSTTSYLIRDHYPVFLVSYVYNSNYDILKIIQDKFVEFY